MAVTKDGRIQSEAILNHVNPNVLGTGQGEARHTKYKRLKLGDGQAYDRSADCLHFREKGCTESTVNWTK
jgi:hypothetical protein